MQRKHIIEYMNINHQPAATLLMIDKKHQSDTHQLCYLLVDD